MAPPYKNYTNKVPSLSQKALEMKLLAEVCTFNLSSIILPTVSILHPPTSTFMALRRMYPDDAVSRTTTTT